VWPEDEADARNVIHNLLELVKKRFHMNVNVSCTSWSTDEGGVIFNIELTVRNTEFFDATPPPEEFRRVVQELQTMIFSD